MKKEDGVNIFIKSALFVGILFFFLMSLTLMGDAFKSVGSEFSKDVLSKVSSPFLGFFIGILATAIVQSSSLTTSTIVTLVIAGLSLENAIPMILGANVGTTVTSSIMAFGHISNRKEYRRAVAAATVHDFFNIFMAIIIFPLEIFFGVLSTPAAYLASKIQITEFKGNLNPIDIFIRPITRLIEGVVGGNHFISISIALILLIISFKTLAKIFSKTVSVSEASEDEKNVFRSDWSSMFFGMGLTAFVNSSSITSSLIVPFVANKKVKLERAFTFLMGANLGTTTTAFFAVLASPSEVGLTLAFVHFLFNLMGILVFFPFKSLRKLPLNLARSLGSLSYKNRLIGVAYVISVFFLLPLLLYAIFK